MIQELKKKSSYQRPFNTLIILQRLIDRESNVIINGEILDDNNISEEISSHKNPAEINDHICDENGMNLVNTEEESDVTPIHYIKATNYISMNDDDTYINKYYSQFLSSKNHEYVSSVA